MKALRSFTVRARLPEALSALQELALNLRWSWDERTQELFRWVDADGWERSRHDPVRLLGSVHGERLDSLAEDPAFRAFLAEVHDDLRRYVDSPRWFQERGESPLRGVAYFSPEFGLTEALPQYSGGLGVLAGDHLKEASALGAPLVGVGLMYRHGYFRQELNADGWQQERYPRLDPHALPLEPVEGARVQVDLAGVPLAAQVWRARVGRVALYLLDADIDDNAEEGRQVTDRLYGGGAEHRLRQEILLGVGGVRALDALGLSPQVFHMNEGHAGFLGLERIRRLMVEHQLSFPEAVEAVRSGTVFTTHTPVPAGIDRFPRDLMERYFKGWVDECGVGFEELMALGHGPGEPSDAPFNMAMMGLRLAAASNAVSRLHGAVSRLMFSPLWPKVPVEEVPIASITNGVHGRTWVSSEMNDLLVRSVLPEWPEAGADRWDRVAGIPDDDLWRVREHGRERLVVFVRQRLREVNLWRAMSEAEVAWCDEALDPRALTIGFARRFASYKRATLLLSQPERLKRLLLSEDRPVQLVYAGKAHPADEPGKDLIRQIVQFSRDPEVRHRIAFVEDYDIAVARTLYQGADVWLNTPRRPLEACGTSGMKATLNGGLNLSVSDGWFDEMSDGENGWVIASAEAYDDLARRDEVEAGSLFDLLERQIVPLFYERAPEDPVPHAWVARIKTSLTSLGPQVSASRMVREYVERMYEPAAERADRLAGDGFSLARGLAGWKAHVRATWPGVAIVDVDADPAALDLGETRAVRVSVELNGLAPHDAQVQLVHGPVGAGDELHDVVTESLRHAGADGSVHHYEGALTGARAGRYGYTVRVVPSHPDLANPIEMGLLTWVS